MPAFLFLGNLPDMAVSGRSEIQLKKATNVGLVALVTTTRLEHEAQAKLDLPLRAQTINTSAVADTERLVVQPSCAVD